MKGTISMVLVLAMFLMVQFCASGQDEHHRATRLGSPATRFAPPLVTPEDLRALFRNDKLKPDVAAILHQWGWTGKLDDLFAAATTAEISDIKIPIGTTMPFMSSRKGGQPVCLRNVLWAGKEPAPAYAFNLTSNSRRYRCVTPKACSNFYLEDLGPEPRYALSVDCAAPAEVITGRPLEICLNVRNDGNVPEPKATVTLPIPQGATVTRTTEGGTALDGNVKWEIADLAPAATKQVCATLATRQPGRWSFAPTASSATVKPVQSACESRIIGLAAILLEVVDLEDPIEVGKEVTYEIRVTNQGTAADAKVLIICTLPDSQGFVSGTGPTAVLAENKTVIMEPLPRLEAGATATWRVVVKALQAADARFKVELSSDQFQQAITEGESTRQY